MEFPEQIGRPVFMPPGSPKALADAVRAGFMATMKDPAFLADAKKANVQIKG